MRCIFLIFLFFTLNLFSFEKDHFRHSFFWNQIKPYESSLDTLIHERRNDIQTIREAFRPLIDHNSLFAKDLQETLREGSLLLCEEGCGAAYCLYDKTGLPRFIIKPCDEEIACLNNPKKYGSPLIEQQFRIRQEIPLYHSAEREALCYEIAKFLDVKEITPKSSLAILSHPNFYPYDEQEKLCSYQEYLSDAQSLTSLLTQFFALGLSDEEIASRFDQEDFEKNNFFLWIIYDTDAHLHNFQAYIKRKDLEGNPIYGLKKIDNALSLPEKNKGFSNLLMYLPNAQKPLSEKIRQKIACISLDNLEKAFDQFLLSSSFCALKQRVDLLKKLIEDPLISSYMISLTLSKLKEE